jgi:putative glycosyltransferase (exosortase G-associated)
MTTTLFGFLMYWGIWLLVPMAIDGTTAIAYLWGAWRFQRGVIRRRRGFVLERFPSVTVIVPVHNGAGQLADCLASIRRQRYPHDKISVLVVDNDSTDDTQQVFWQQNDAPFEGRMELIALEYAGKSWALNAGIHLSDSDYVCNLDADTRLKSDALLCMVRAFEADRRLAAATGSIEVAPVEGGAEMHPIKRAFAQAEFVEYLVAFRIGRQFQSHTGNLFTLAGAFSFFRRDVLMRTTLYNNMTVSEDTNLTFEIREKFPEMSIEAVSEAVAYTAPTASLSALYAQRVRWQRGEIEVLSIFSNPAYNPFRMSRFKTLVTLLVDHTLVFPRIIWTFLLPLMFVVGYPMGLVISAMALLYLVYGAIDALFLVVAYGLSDGETRRRIRSCWWVFVVLPAFRYVTFWFRIGGFLEVLNEPAQWRVRNPWEQTRDALRHMVRSLGLYLGKASPHRLFSLMSSVFRTR